MTPVRRISSHRRAFEDCWLKFLSFNLPNDLYKVLYIYIYIILNKILITIILGSLKYFRRYFSLHEQTTTIVGILQAKF